MRYYLAQSLSLEANQNPPVSLTFSREIADLEGVGLDVVRYSVHSSQEGRADHADLTELERTRVDPHCQKVRVVHRGADKQYLDQPHIPHVSTLGEIT